MKRRLVSLASMLAFASPMLVGGCSSGSSSSKTASGNLGGGGRSDAGATGAGGISESGGTTPSGAAAGGRGGGGDGGGVHGGSGGATAAACSPACTVDQDCVGGRCIPSQTHGGPCRTAQDCPVSSTCDDSSDESFDATRLPKGDGLDPDEFTVSADGLMVTDAITGLIWQRDGSGTRSECDGVYCSWSEANAYCAGLVLGGVSGWRLPGRHELLTIVEVNVQGLSIDSAAFPDTPADTFWTSSAYGDPSDYAWYVYFGSNVGYLRVGNASRVRCVRPAAALRCHPKSRFVVLDGGLVRDTLTGLVWQQQTSTTKLSLSDATEYCSTVGTGFRMPTLKELDSIVDLTVTSGAIINQAVFPNTPAEGFWTSSPVTPYLHDMTWGVYFNSAWFFQAFSEAHASVYWVRCVR
jgi:hypothetical protein